MPFMRERTGNTGAFAALLLVATTAGAQQKQPESAPAPAPAAKGDAKGGAQGDAKAGGQGDAKADPGKASDAAADEKEKKPSLTPGYSWTDKPAKPGKWRPKKKIDPNAPIATFPGFRMLGDGSSQVWVQVTRKVNVTATATSFVLVGAQVNVRNNTNALVTEFFDTPLARAKLKPDPAGAQLVLELRESVAAKHRIVDGPGGSMMLYIDLPKAQKTYSLHDDFQPDSRKSRSTGKVLPGTGKSARKRGPSQ
jgi:hypothetical protein